MKKPTFKEEIQDPQTAQEAKSKFVLRWYRACQETNNPPGTWRAGESEEETFDRLGEYAEKIAVQYADYTWDEIASAWDRGIRNSGVKPNPFNIGSLYYFMGEYLPKRNDYVPPPKVEDLKGQEAIDFYLPKMKESLNSENKLIFVVPGARFFWQELKIAIGSKALTEINNRVLDSWEKQTFAKTGKRRKPGESIESFCERLAVDFTHHQIPPFSLPQRIEILRTYLEITHGNGSTEIEGNN
jgi:hypothetical protein